MSIVLTQRAQGPQTNSRIGNLGGRSRFAQTVGKSFAGNRDIYAEAGYKRELTPEDFWGKYLRQDVARRICSIFADETWRKPPEILDGSDPDTAKDNTEFVKAWQELASPPARFDEIQERRTIWHYFKRVDRLSALGEFAVLLLGIKDGGDLTAALKKVSADSASRSLLYLSPFSQNRIELDETNLVTDPQDRRFGLPARYKIALVKEKGHSEVHWSRVIHVAERLDDSEVFGTPLLEFVFNRLDDLDQVLAGSKEAFWKLIQKGLIFSKKEGFGTSTEISEDDLASFIHGLTRTLEVEGWDINILGGEAVDPSAIVDVILTVISVALGIPKRILMGSERGELSSTQDEKSWNDVIEARRVEFAEPVILRPTINRLVYAGVLPRPQSGQYIVKWPSLFETSEKEKAEIAKTYTAALKELATPGVENLVKLDGVIKALFELIPPDAVLDALSQMEDLIDEDTQGDTEDEPTEDDTEQVEEETGTADDEQ